MNRARLERRGGSDGGLRALHHFLLVLGIRFQQHTDVESKKTSGNHDYKQGKDHPIANVRIQEDILRAHDGEILFCAFFVDCEL